MPADGWIAAISCRPRSQPLPITRAPSPRFAARLATAMSVAIHRDDELRLAPSLMRVTTWSPAIDFVTLSAGVADARSGRRRLS